MRLLPSLALAFSLCATPLLAQDEPASETRAITDCQSLVESFDTMLTGGERSTIEDLDNGCRFTNVYINTGTMVRWLVGEVEISGSDVLASLAAERLPESLMISMTGLHLSPDRGGPIMAYLSENQSPPFSLHLEYDWDRDSKILTIEHLGMRTFGGHFSVSGEIGDIAALPADIEDLSDLPGASFRSLKVKLDNQGVFESFFMPAMVSALPADQDPRETIPPIQTMIKGFIHGLPAGVINDEGRQVLTDFVDAFPHPAGLYELTLTAREPISQADIMAAGSEASAITLLAERLQMTALHVAEPSPHTSGNP